MQTFEIGTGRIGADVAPRFARSSPHPTPRRRPELHGRHRRVEGWSTSCLVGRVQRHPNPRHEDSGSASDADDIGRTLAACLHLLLTPGVAFESSTVDPLRLGKTNEKVFCRA